MGTLAIGAGLIGGGEYIRRRHGDDIAETATRYLPSTFAGAGIFALFSGVLAARVLYGLISAPTTLGGLVITSMIAIVLGWFYGPVLAAIGIIGATVAPFLVGGASDSAWVFYYYFAALAVAGLAVDTVKRWAWTSALTLVATVGGATFLYMSLGQGEHYLTFFMIAFVASVAIPVRQAWPTHGGASITDVLTGSDKSCEFPTRIAVGMSAALRVAGFVHTLAAGSVTSTWVGFGVLFVVLMSCLIWMRHAPALTDLAIAPATALTAAIMAQPMEYGHLFRMTLPDDIASLWMPLAVIIAGVSVVSIVAYRRSMLATDPTHQQVWTLAAAAFAPVIVLLIEFLWIPSLKFDWAMMVMGVGVVMTTLAVKSAQSPASDGRQFRIAIFAASALIMVALAMFIILTKTALTLALGGVVVLAGLLDRRFDLRILGYVAQLGVAVIGYRLIADPGYHWATKTATFGQAFIAYGGGIACVTAGWTLFDRDKRTSTRATLESAIWTLGAVFVCVVLHRMMGTGPDRHWSVGLFATVMAVSMMAQLYRLQVADGIIVAFRKVLAGLFGLLTGVFVLMQFGVNNPLTSSAEIVRGPYLLDSLALAYLPLAAVFAVGAWRITALGRQIRIGFIAIAATFGVWYLALEIRRMWQGDVLATGGVSDGELYTYTVVMLLGAVATLFTAFFRRSDVLRKIAMASVAVTIAKVFLIDMAGLTGLIRVASFMGLGLGLAGLAWLNRKMTDQWERDEPSVE
jgi:uncharacterized membrane protein